MQVEITREWVTYKQAEELSGLSRTTLWKLLSAGESRQPALGELFASIVVLSMDTWSRLRRVHREAGRSVELTTPRREESRIMSLKETST